MSAYIPFACPKCNALMEAPVALAGTKTNCKTLNCRQRLQIPSAERAKTILAAGSVVDDDPQPPANPVTPTMAAQVAPAPPPTSGGGGQMREKVYYDQDDIRISTTRASFGARTFMVNGMTSVRAIVINPNRIPPILLLLASIFASTCCGCVGIASVSAGGGRVGIPTPAALGW